MRLYRLHRIRVDVIRELIGRLNASHHEDTEDYHQSNNRLGHDIQIAQHQHQNHHQDGYYIEGIYFSFSTHNRLIQV